MSLTPASRRREQQLARWVRRAPGYQLLLTQALPRVRRSAVLTDLAWRVFAPRHDAGHVDVPLRGGHHLQGSDLSLLPVVGVVATGLGEEDVDRLVEEVARLQRDTAAFRPLLVLDRPAFAAARRHGYVLEVLLPEEGWSGPGPWSDYLGTRLASLVDHYQLWHLAVTDGPRLGPATVAMLTRLADRLPPDLRVTTTTPTPDEETQTR